MERRWLKQYPAGVESEVDLQAYASLKAILESSCRSFGDLPAYTNMGSSIRDRDLDRLSRNFGAYLQQVAGLRKATG